MSWTRQLGINRKLAYVMLSFGLALAVASAVLVSSVLAFLGLGFIFWGALLLYIAPSSHVPLELLTASVSSSLANIEKVIADMKLNGKGVYLAPRYLKNLESSLVFIPLNAQQNLPTPQEVVEEELHSRNLEGIFLAPPGLALSKLFEDKLGTTFTRVDLNYVAKKLPKLFIEDLEIAENAEVKIEDDEIAVEITNHIFHDVCNETRKLGKLHESVGCPLCSAIAAL